VTLFGGREIRRVLVRSTNWVGDALMTEPALDALSKNFPAASLTVLARPWVAAVFRHHPAVNELLEYDPAGPDRGPGGFLRTARKIRASRFDLAVLFQYAFGAGLMVWLAGVPERLGHATDGRRLLLTRPVALRPEDRQRHVVDLYLELLRRAGLEAGRSDPVFYLGAEAERVAEEKLAGRGLAGSFLLGLAPGAAFGSAKRWSAERFAAAADRILEKTGGAALIFGGDSEAVVSRAVREGMKAPAWDLAGGTSLTEAGALIQRCGLFLTNDSGLMHVAGAVGTPLVAVFGSTDAATTGPAASRARVVQSPVDCAPCLKRRCPLPSHRCMDLVTPDMVVEAALGLLAEGGDRERGA
jgi:heptosyltransferase-2